MKSSKNYKRTAIVVSVMSFCLIVLLIVGSSYAYWRTTRTQGDTNELTTTCLDIDLTNITSGINLDTQFPITEKEGRETKGYTFKVTNKCDTYVSYDVNLESLSSVAEANRLNLNYLDAILDDGNVLDLGSYKSTESILKAADGVAYDTRTLTTDTIGPKDSANASKEYTLRVWIDEAATNTEMNKSWSGKITVSASPVIAENAVTKLTELARTNTNEMFTDDTSDANIRYMGANPANYVDLGNGYYYDDVYYGYAATNQHYNYREYTSMEACQTGVEGTTKYNVDCEKIHSKGEPILWRVIGVMNNVDDGTGKKESRLKVVRDDVIGEIYWDGKCTTGYDDTTGGCDTTTEFNNWPEASLNKTLNEAYYNSTKTTEPNYAYSRTTLTGRYQYLNFSNTGFKSKSQNLVGDAVYYLGGVVDDDTSEYYYETATASKWYQAERSTNVYSDANKTNPTTWTGKVGLMYASDYGYATSGGSTTDKAACAAKELYNWDASEFADCKNNNWLYENTYYQWLINPFASSDNGAAYVSNAGYVGSDDGVDDYYRVRPVLYLKSDVKIVSGNGTESSPYKLSA